MAEGPEIVRPTAREDRPGALVLAALASFALAAGLVLSRASAEGIRWIPAPRIERVSGSGPAEAVAASPSRARPRPSGAAHRSATASATYAGLRALAGAASSALRVGATPSAPPVVARVPERRPVRHRVTIAPGRVAYLRCDGAQVEEGLFPCPRDRALEQRAWAAILALGTCHDLATSDPPAVGRADAWLVFNGPVLGGIRMRESPGAEAVSTAIRTCLEERLGGLRSTVGSERMTVSFRFDLS
jgi:hypothetical protein